MSRSLVPNDNSPTVNSLFSMIRSEVSFIPSIVTSLFPSEEANTRLSTEVPINLY